MKLRILGNSIRLRLTQTEVRELGTGKQIRETTNFGSQNYFTYELNLSASNKVSAICQSNSIIVELPETAGKLWAEGAEISWRETLKLDNGDELSVLVEKDFKCKTERVGESESDMFPNPDC